MQQAHEQMEQDHVAREAYRAGTRDVIAQLGGKATQGIWNRSRNDQTT